MDKNKRNFQSLDVSLGFLVRYMKCYMLRAGWKVTESYVSYLLEQYLDMMKKKDKQINLRYKNCFQIS